MPALLEARGLRAGYGETKVLHGIDFSVEQGGVTALLGANGAGKTTTLRAICGLIRPQGEIRLGADRIDRLAAEEIVRRGVGHVPDGRGTFLELTVDENLRLGAYIRKDRATVGIDIERMFGYFPVPESSGCTNRQARCRAASSRCWRSPGHCWSSRGCCCWTSRRSGWRR